MHQNTHSQIAALGKMTPAHLRDKYIKVSDDTRGQVTKPVNLSTCWLTTIRHRNATFSDYLVKKPVVVCMNPSRFCIMSSETETFLLVWVVNHEFQQH